MGSSGSSRTLGLCQPGSSRAVTTADSPETGYRIYPLYRLWWEQGDSYPSQWFGGACEGATMRDAFVTGIGTLPTGEYEDIPERDMFTHVVTAAIEDAGVALTDIDGVYMPKPRPWAPQGFFTTYMINRLGLDVNRNLELYTGGTSGGLALHGAVSAVRADRADVAVVAAVERDSIVDTDAYFDYVLGLFDHEFQSPIGPSVPGMYAQSLQRYLHEYDVDREDVAAITVKNRDNGAANPEGLFDESTTVDRVLNSDPIADPLRVYECPLLCDGAAAVVVTANGSDSDPIVSGLGYAHPPSHLMGSRTASLSTLPAVAPSVGEALADGNATVEDVDVFEPYCPFPHIEAMFTEEIGLFDHGTGAAHCAQGVTRPDGRVPVSPSGGCIGRGHPAMVTPTYNHVEAVRQLRGTASQQIDDARTVITTSEHGHVDGMATTVFTTEASA